ncbi:hypothetical protein F2Q70_00013781 [Brassica cretica]|uniref:Uncharacterized protein n=1 Tax=Brassica cretica TaxID=69181 RepID=A0A8S9M3Y5_BRACR|nr:hypothetical protein F2Q70_00013781 [Brassica cretica]
MELFEMFGSIVIQKGISNGSGFKSFEDVMKELRQFTRGISTLFEHPGATSQSDLPRSLPARATSPERLSQVAPSQSDQPRATISSRSSQSDQPRATISSRSSQSDQLKSLAF